MFETVIFDLYGTLADIRTDERREEVWLKTAEFYGRNGARYAPRELRDAYFGLVSALEGERSSDAHEGHPEIEITGVFSRLFEAKNVRAGRELAVRAGEIFRSASTDYIRLYPGAVRLLDDLRSAGRQVYLLTNAQRIFTYPELLRLGIAEKFHGIYISSDYGVKKPDPRFFNILLRERHIDPNEAVMVGNDGVCDVAGAGAVGLHTVYIRSDISPAGEPTPKADLALEEMDLSRVRDFLLGDAV